jgi:hypothetical protein
MQKIFSFLNAKKKSISVIMQSHFLSVIEYDQFSWIIGGTGLFSWLIADWILSCDNRGKIFSVIMLHQL